MLTLGEDLKRLILLGLCLAASSSKAWCQSVPAALPVGLTQIQIPPAMPSPALEEFRAALRASQHRPVTIVGIGDSIFCCAGPRDLSDSPLSQLREDLNPFGSHGSGVIPLGNNTGLSTRGEWTLTGAWSTVDTAGPFQKGTGGFGSTFVTSGTATATLHAQIGDRLAVYGAAAKGDSGWDVLVDGKLVGTVGAYRDGSPGTYRVELASVAGIHTTVLQPHDGGTARLYGVEWIAGDQGVTVHNVAHGYARTEAWGTQDAQMAYIDLMSPRPDLAIIALGVNDSINGTSVTAQQYRQNMQSIIDHLLHLNPKMSILIADEHNVRSPGTLLPQTQIRSIERELAAAKHAAYVSIADIEGSEANAETLGLMATDGIHDSDKGGILWGKILQSSITAGVFGSQPSISLNVVFCGDSITFGAGVANAGTTESPTVPYFAIKSLSNLPAVAAVYGSNQGHSGHTTTSWLPGKDDYNHARDAMTALIAAHPDAVQVFSFLLGTNDSASNGTDNGLYKSALPVRQFQSNLEGITEQLLHDFPKARVVWNDAPYYTPNTHNRSTYEQAGLDRLQEYRAATGAAVQHFAKKPAGHVFIGDTAAFDYFKEHYLDELRPEKTPAGELFYLHPSGRPGADGKIGTQTLGDMDATAIARALGLGLTR